MSSNTRPDSVNEVLDNSVRPCKLTYCLSSNTQSDSVKLSPRKTQSGLIHRNILFVLEHSIRLSKTKSSKTQSDLVHRNISFVLEHSIRLSKTKSSKTQSDLVHRNILFVLKHLIRLSELYFHILLAPESSIRLSKRSPRQFNQTP